MRPGNKKVFIDKVKLTEMLNLRLMGFSYNILANMFGVDRTSLSFQCDRYQVQPLQVYNLKGIVSHHLPKPEPEKWKIINGERFHI